MKIQLKNGLPIVSLNLTHDDRTNLLPNVLFDTGCAATVFDTDLLNQIGIHIDFIFGKAIRMYGVGGSSEICYEQNVSLLQIQDIILNDFPIQLGSVQEPYGFDGILGIDFMIRLKCHADFEAMQINFFN